MVLAATQPTSSGGDVAVAIVVWIVLIAAYWAPTIVGAITHKPNLSVIAVLNVFAFLAGVTWVIAWVKVAERPQQPTIVFAPPQGPQWQPPAPRPPSPTGDYGQYGRDVPEGYR